MIHLEGLENDFFGDIIQMPFYLWELYGFVRLWHEDEAEIEIHKIGYNLLELWVGREWLTATASDASDTILSGKEILEDVRKLGLKASDPDHGILLLSLTEKAKSEQRP